MKYCIKITYPSGFTSYMLHRGRTSWCLKTARKHLKDWVHLHGISAEIEMA